MTFRAVIHGGAKLSRSNLALYIEQWIESDVSIPVQSVQINIDSSCIVTISSFDDRECQVHLMRNEQDSNTACSDYIGGTASALLLVLYF